MNLESATVELLRQASNRLAGSAGPPAVRALHLPPHRRDDPQAGESCAIELDEGSIGLSYVLFGDAPGQLRATAAALAGAAAALPQRRSLGAEHQRWAESDFGTPGGENASGVGAC